MPFVNYNEQTGLVVKSKADIMEDLKSICKTAYGNSFNVVEGTEMYTLLDVLSSSLAETGAAAKAVYDSFGFITAKGAPLSVLCSLAGLARKPGEPDSALRARYFKFLYEKSVGTVNGLESQLLQLTDAITTGNTTEIKSLLSEVKITNNSQPDADPNPTFIPDIEIPGHSIAVVCRNGDRFYEITSDKNAVADTVYYIKYNGQYYIESGKGTGDSLEDGTYYTAITDTSTIKNLREQISTTVAEYKSLGCGVLRESGNTDDTTNLYWVAQPKTVEMELTLTYQGGLEDSQKSAIQNAITQNIKDYINQLHIEEPILYSGIMGCVYKAYADLGYSTYMFECTVIEYVIGSAAAQTLSQGGRIDILANEYAQCYSVVFTVSP